VSVTVPRLVALRETPRLYLAEGLVRADECDRLRALAEDAAWRAARGVESRRDRTGFSCELPVAGDLLIADVARRIEATVGLCNELGETLRYRSYAPGEGHPPHLDTYAFAGLHLVATAMLCLVGPELGGETCFPYARPPVAIGLRAGQMLHWYNYTQEGEEDRSSWHLGLSLLRGAKVTLTAFIYAELRRAVRACDTGETRRSG
jgi:hypothetical protein